MEPSALKRKPARLVSMDAMRGLAIFGIFMVNIQVMAMPFEWMMDPSYAQGAEVWAWGATTALFEREAGTLRALKQRGVTKVGAVLLYVSDEGSEKHELPQWWRRRGLKILEAIA